MYETEGGLQEIGENSMRKSWTGHVACIRLIKAYKFLVGKSQGTRHTT
jgi:hypothetical protein